MPRKNIEADWEHLEAFLAIHAERSVTRAAQRLGRTQSALSKQLGRLRELFGDELFTYIGGAMAPTARATELHPSIVDLVERWGSLLNQAAFDERKVTERYVISTTDEVERRLALPLLESLRMRAPEARLMFRPLAPDYSRSALEEGRVHLVVSVNWSAPEHLVQTQLMQDEFVLALRHGHPLARGKLTLPRYAAAEHLLVAPLGQEKGVMDEALERLSLTRNVRLYLQHFHQAGQILAKTDLIALLPRRLAAGLPERDCLVLRRPPVQVPSIDYYAFWHRRYENDPVHQLLRKVLSDVVGRASVTS